MPMFWSGLINRDRNHSGKLNGKAKLNGANFYKSEFCRTETLWLRTCRGESRSFLRGGDGWLEPGDGPSGWWDESQLTAFPSVTAYHLEEGSGIDGPYLLRSGRKVRASTTSPLLASICG